jgi:hypothetical protein
MGLEGATRRVLNKVNLFRIHIERASLSIVLSASASTLARNSAAPSLLIDGPLAAKGPWGVVTVLISGNTLLVLELGG